MAARSSADQRDARVPAELIVREMCRREKRACVEDVVVASTELTDRGNHPAAVAIEDRDRQIASCCERVGDVLGRDRIPVIGRAIRRAVDDVIRALTVAVDHDRVRAGTCRRRDVDPHGLGATRERRYVED
jgi:hypothetical protein